MTQYFQFQRCVGKTPHETPKAASAELKRSRGPKMSVYKCKDCGAYHIGHKNGGRTFMPNVKIKTRK